MHSTLKKISTFALCTIAATAIAAPPRQLITHNRTNYQSNGYVAGVIPSQHPTQPQSDGVVYWAAVKMACFGHIENNRCSAIIMMASDTDHPIPVGTLTMDLGNGDIEPKQLSGNGFTITVNGPAETTITQN